jgi:hypothetical protein
MSTELVIRIWDDNEISPTAQLLNLMKIFELNEVSQEGWKGLTIQESDLSKKTPQSNKVLSSQEINTALAEYNRDDLPLSVRSAFSCWRFDGTIIQKGFVPFWIEAWGDSFTNKTGRCKEIEGDAAISLVNSGPFVALTQSEDAPQIQNINQHIEKNLESVTDLILAIAENLNPLAMKVFTDQGLYQPLNAHLIFFRDRTVLLNDLIFLKKLWNEGLQNYHTTPLREWGNSPDSYVLHHWRGLETSQKIYNRLASLIDKFNHLDTQNFDFIEWSHYDNYESKNGRLVLDYPYFVNSFLDHFYIDLLSNVVDK